jgi:hypothetical protein
MLLLVSIFFLIASTELVQETDGFQPGITSRPLFRAGFSSTARTSSTPVSSSSELDEEDAVIFIDNVAEYCGVRPPTNYRTIPLVKHFARWTWRQRVTVLRMLHWKDPWTPVDSCINLECLWWKVLSTTDPSSPCFESIGYTYDLLPRPGRRLITSLRRFHPRWIHALLEVRMAYLNQAVQTERRRTNHLTDRVRVISLGAGYDVRSIRLLAADDEESNQQPIECFEFDLPSTIDSKRQLVQERLSKRQERRRKRGQEKENLNTSTTLRVPTMIGLDLNDTPEFERQLQLIFSSPEETKEEIITWHTIFVVEGVLMYLDEGKAAAVLRACADAARKSEGCASLCFADRLFDSFDCDPEPVRHELAETGWKLHEWAPNPNANAKHMGIGRLL